MAATYSWALTESYLGKNDDPSSFETQNDMRFKTVAENTDLKSVNYDQGGYRIQNYEDIGVLDLNLVHNPDASFTIEFTAKELGDALYMDKAVNYITFGYHIRGRSDVTVSVGRDVGQPYVVLSVIRESDTVKSTIRDTKFVTLPNEEYVYTLTYNSFATDDEKIKLYRNFDLISSSATLDVQNLSIVDRKLFLGSSGWINEPSWNNTFDVIQDTVFLNEINFHTNKVLDKEFSPGTPRYPIHHSLANISDSTRNSRNMVTTGDVLELKFHSIFDVPPSAVTILVEGASNIVQTNVDNSFPTTDFAGEQIVSKLYTFQLTATSSNLNEFFSYGVNMDGSETPSNIIPPTGNLYVDNTPASIGFSVQAPSAHNVSVVFDSLIDNMYTDMELPNFNDYSIVFYASNATDVKSNEIPGSSMALGTTYFIEGLADESFYNVYATITDPVSQTSDRILPTVTEQSLIETNDITQPVIVSITPSTTRKDSDFSPGVKIDVSAYDTATKNGNTYDLFVGVFNHELAGDDAAKAATIVANNIYAETKSNHAAETFSMDVFSMFDDQMAALPVAPETELYIYCLARDQSNNETVSVASFTIYNTLTFISFASDYTDDTNIAKQGNTLTLQFESAFRLFNADNLDVKILDSTVVPTSTNGVQWIAEKLITLSHPSGPAQFSATNGTSGQPGSSFADVYNVYVQTADPTINAGYTFSPNLQAINVNNIADYIDDFTINSNDNAFDLEITAGGTTFTSNYNVKADVPDVISLPNLIENTTYDVRATVTNVFNQSKQVNLGTVTTLFDTPSVTVVAGAGRTSDGEPTVDLKNASVVSENTTAFDLYVEMTDFPIDNLEAASNFFLNTAGMTKRSEDTPPAENIALNTLSQTSFMKYWTSNEVSGFVGDNTLVPTNNSIYYLTALVNDGRAPLAYSTDSVEFSYRITDATLSNSTNGYYVRNSDTVVLEWSTFFRSYPENYSNLRIFDIPATPTSSDDFTWRAEVTLPGDGSISDSHTMFYLGSNVSIDDTHLLLDNYPTTFDVTNVGVTVDSITMKLENLYDRGYSVGPVPIGINNLFNVEYSASNAAGKITYPAQELSFTNLGLTNFVLDGLQEFTTYSVEFTVTDPAENVSTIGFEGGNVISTAEPNVPIITNAYATFSNIEGTNRIIASNIGAYDVQSEFNVYIGVLSTSNYLDYLNSNTLKDFAGTGVFVAENNPKSSDYQYFDAELATSLYYDISTSTWRKRNILYEAEHYVIAFAEDIYGNSAWVNNAQLGVVFTGEAPIPEEAIEIPPETSATAGMETLSGADTNIQFQEVANDDGTVTYEGVDATGNTSNNIVINAISNPFNNDSLTGEQSLDMGLVVDGVELPQSTYEDSNLTYSLNIKKVDGTFGSGTVLFESSTNPDVALTITDETLTLSTNEQHTGTYLLDPATTEADSWNNITLSQEVVEESTQFQIFINGNELYPSQVTGTSTSVNTSGSVLRIPAQTDMLVDGIVIYNSPANLTTVSQLGNTAIFKVKLDFEDAFVVEFDTKLHQDRFIFNDDMNRPGLILNKNVVYTFNQTNEGLPLIFSATGEYPIPETDTINVNYYLNDVLIGNDPTRYAQEFFASPKNKVVLRPADDDYTMYYHSTDTQVVPPKFVTLGTGDSKLHNKATTATGMQPNYLTTPKFTSNTVAGSYSMLFNKQNEDYLFFNNLNMDANTMTMSMWINPEDTLNADNGMPLIAQKDAFEFGLDKDGKMYFDVLRNDTTAPILDDKGVYAMTDEAISMSNITLKSPIKSTTYMYAMASQAKLSKLEAMQLMDQFKDQDLVFTSSFTSGSSTTIPEFDLTAMLASDKSSTVDIDRVTSANVYVGFRYSTDAFVYGMSNDFLEASVKSADTGTRLVMDASDVDLVGGVPTLSIEFSLFNNSTTITQYVAFGVLQNADGTVGPNNIIVTPEIVEAFIYSTEFNDALATNIAAGAVKNYTSPISAKSLYIASGAAVSLTSAFTDLTTATAATPVAVADGSSYATIVAAFTVANALEVGTVTARGGANLFSISRNTVTEEEEEEPAPTSTIVINQYENLTSGDGTFSLDATGTVNAYAYVTDTSIPKGTTVLNVEDATGFAENDSVLVHQTQFYKNNVSTATYSRAGMYETAVIKSVEGNVITLARGLKKGYFSGEAYGISTNVTQLVRIPRYDTFSIADGATLEPEGWNGKTGGICILRAETFEMNGTCSVSASEKGFRGGGGNSCGEGIRGGGKETEAAGSRVTAATRNGAASSSIHLNTGGGSSHGNLFGCGGGRGGGGGHIARGRHGGCPHGHYNNQTFGYAAPGAGHVGRHIHFGGGGGGGGHGGGAVIIIAKNFAGDGTKVFESDGEITGNSCGAGGSVILITEDEAAAANFQLNVAGGVSSWSHGGDSSDGVKRVLSFKQKVKRAKGEFFGTKAKKMGYEFEEDSVESAEVTTTEKTAGTFTVKEAVVKNVRHRVRKVMVMCFEEDANNQVGGANLTVKAVKKMLHSDEFKADLDALVTAGAVYVHDTPLEKGQRLDITDVDLTKAFTSTTYTADPVVTAAIDDTKKYFKVMVLVNSLPQYYNVPPRFFIRIKASDPWASFPKSTKYRISMKAIDDSSNGDFRGTELAFVSEYLEPTENYFENIPYTISPSGYNVLHNGDTVQNHVSQLPNSEMYRVLEITYTTETQIRQIYVGSTDNHPNNNSRSFDKEIKIEAWNGSAYVPHSTVIWEDLPDANGVTRATSGDNYFPWQPSHNTSPAQQIYPLVGGRGKQILRYDINQGRWYHYVAYGYPNTVTAGVSSWPKTFDYDGTGAKTVY